MKLAEYITAIPDFPKPGILFRDMSPLLASPVAFAETISQMKAYWANRGHHEDWRIRCAGIYLCLCACA